MLIEAFQANTTGREPHINEANVAIDFSLLICILAGLSLIKRHTLSAAISGAIGLIIIVTRRHTFGTATGFHQACHVQIHIAATAAAIAAVIAAATTAATFTILTIVGYVDETPKDSSSSEIQHSDDSDRVDRQFQATTNGRGGQSTVIIFINLADGQSVVVVVINHADGQSILIVIIDSRPDISDYNTDIGSSDSLLPRFYI